MTLHRVCDRCGWRRGGVDSWNGKACKCGISELPMPNDDTTPKWSPLAEMTHCLINGVHYVKTPGGNWAPDYSQPGTAESVKESVDEAVEQHWSIDRWKK